MNTPLAVSTVCVAMLSCAGPRIESSAPVMLRLLPSEVSSWQRSPQQATGTSGIAGIETGLLKGNPNKLGVYTIILRVPAHTRIDAHQHPDDRVATVLAGTWYFGFGAAFDEHQLRALPPGSFYTEPPNAPHFARTGDEPALVLITGMGPSATTFENE